VDFEGLMILNGFFFIGEGDINIAVFFKGELEGGSGARGYLIA
jgi:hypothetical protein